MQTPLVSIIIPTYNRAHLIGETLDSVLAQTYTNWECIVVDDRSTDETDKLLQFYCNKDVRFKYHHRPKNSDKGANACRNYGFKLSKGTYINWFDSDDLMLPNKLEMQVSQLEKCAEAPYSICQSFWYDKEKNKSLGLRAKHISSSNRFEDYILYKIFWLTTAPIWRKSFLEINNLAFDETLSQSQEYDFHIHALAISEDYLIIDEPLVQIIKHQEAISYDIFDDEQKLLSNLKVKNRIFNKYSNSISDKGKIKLYEIVTLLFKELLTKKKFKIAFKAMTYLFKNIKHLEIPIIDKINFLCKLSIAFTSYLIFGRGYNLVRPIK